MPVLRNVRHERFVQELVKGKSVTDAYEAAGYVRNASHGYQLRRRPLVAARIDELLGRAAAKAEVNAERVLRELALIGFANMHDYARIGPDGDPYLDFSGLTRDQAAAIVEMIVEDFKDGRGKDARDVRRVKFKLADKKGALVDIGRHLGMFRDRTVLENPDGSGVAPVVIFQLPDNGR
ncbi:MAG TPA: terminase small subunit [Allosphingosinicella sp.]|jgi:phage terminase small subunit|nr:terminase small subunit [Allosphingosinicella sp.]